MKKLAKILLILIMLLAIAIIAAALVLRSQGALEPGWHKLGGRQYFINDDGKPAEGYQVIDGQPYYFDRLGIPADKGWITGGSGAEDEAAEDAAANDDAAGDTTAENAGEEVLYYCDGGGKLLTGWHYLDSKAWYFYEESSSDGSHVAGEIAREYTSPGGIYIGEQGYVDGKEGEALGYGMDVLNRYGWDLESAYKYSAALRYADGREDDYGLRVHSCAWHGFKYGEGNCLAWAGTFCVMARLLGYDARMVWGTLEFREEDVTHSWIEIPEADGPHIYDPRRNNGQDMSGFDKQYGEAGTYKYNLDSITYLDW